MFNNYLLMFCDIRSKVACGAAGNNQLLEVLLCYQRTGDIVKSTRMSSTLEETFGRPRAARFARRTLHIYNHFPSQQFISALHYLA